MPVSELRARLDIRELPEEERGRYNTVAGLADGGVGPPAGSGRAHRMRAAGRFEVVDLDGRRIDKVLARPIVEPWRRLMAFCRLAMEIQ